jgi:hypothetical protein
MPKRNKKEAETLREDPAEDDLHVPEQVESSDAESDEPEAAANGVEDSDAGSLDSDDEDFREALTDYVTAAAANRGPSSGDAGEAGPNAAEE